MNKMQLQKDLEAYARVSTILAQDRMTHSSSSNPNHIKVMELPEVENHEDITNYIVAIGNDLHRVADLNIPETDLTQIQSDIDGLKTHRTLANIHINRFPAVLESGKYLISTDVGYQFVDPPTTVDLSALQNEINALKDRVATLEATVAEHSTEFDNLDINWPEFSAMNNWYKNGGQNVPHTGGLVTAPERLNSVERLLRHEDSSIGMVANSTIQAGQIADLTSRMYVVEEASGVRAAN